MGTVLSLDKVNPAAVQGADGRLSNLIREWLLVVLWGGVSLYLRHHELFVRAFLGVVGNGAISHRVILHSPSCRMQQCGTIWSLNTCMS